MGGKPRNQQEWAPRPSPLARVHLTRPISQDPSMGLVRDPQFWKRFSLAVHLTEDVEKAPRKGSIDTKDGDAWLAKQHKKKKKCRILCVCITVGVAILIAGAVVLALALQGLRHAD